MDYKIIKEEKNVLEVELDNLTVAEIIRKELWNDASVKVSAWKKEHPTKNPVLVIFTEGKTAKKALQDAVARIRKISNSLLSESKKLK